MREKNVQKRPMSLRRKVIWFWLPPAFFFGCPFAKWLELKGAWRFTAETVVGLALLFYLGQIAFSATYRRELIFAFKSGGSLPEED